MSTDNGIYAYEYVEVQFETISKVFMNTIELSKIEFVLQSKVNEKQLKLIINQFSNIKVFKQE